MKQRINPIPIIMNSFKQLQEEEERQHPPPPEIEENIMGNMRFLKFFGEMIELFIPRMIEMFAAMLGGRTSSLGKEEVDKNEID